MSPLLINLGKWHDRFINCTLYVRSKDSASYQHKLLMHRSSLQQVQWLCCVVNNGYISATDSHTWNKPVTNDYMQWLLLICNSPMSSPAPFSCLCTQAHLSATVNLPIHQSTGAKSKRHVNCTIDISVSPVETVTSRADSMAPYKKGLIKGQTKWKD